MVGIRRYTRYDDHHDDYNHHQISLRYILLFLSNPHYLIAHNNKDVKYYKGLTNKPVNKMPTLMLTESLNILPRSESGEAVIIGGNMVRWYGITNNHGRVIHFQANNTGTINYCNTGSGSNTGLASAMTTLSGHSANIPGSATTFQQGWTDFAFYQPGQYHWGLKGGNRWEVDDFPGNESKNTLHRVWVRYAS